MREITKKQYVCRFCGKVYDIKDQCDEHERSCTMNPVVISSYDAMLYRVKVAQNKIALYERIEGRVVPDSYDRRIGTKHTYAFVDNEGKYYIVLGWDNPREHINEPISNTVFSQKCILDGIYYLILPISHEPDAPEESARDAAAFEGILNLIQRRATEAEAVMRQIVVDIETAEDSKPYLNLNAGGY